MKIVRFTYQTLDGLNVGSFFIEDDEIELYIHGGIFSFNRNKIVRINGSVEPLFMLHPQVNLIVGVSNTFNPSSIKNFMLKSKFDMSQLSVWDYKGEKQYSIKLTFKDFLKINPFLLLII